MRFHILHLDAYGRPKQVDKLKLFRRYLRIDCA